MEKTVLVGKKYRHSSASICTKMALRGFVTLLVKLDKFSAKQSKILKNRNFQDKKKENLFKNSFHFHEASLISFSQYISL